MEKKALFLGRVQPPHLWYIDALNQATAQWITKILIWIGSSDKEYSADNPFTLEERKEMMRKLIQSQDNKILLQACENIYWIPDFNNDELWKNYILENIPQFDYIISGNPWVCDIFNKTGIKTISIKRNIEISASTIRKWLSQWNKVDCMEFVPENVIKYIEQIWWIKRLNTLLKERLIPRLAVDIVLFDEHGNLVLIKRKHPPYGLAIPGGMVEYGEEPSISAVREAKEELWVDIQIIWDKNKPFGVYWDPQRDPRGHVISIVYKWQIIWWELKAWDDAAQIVLVKPSDFRQHKLAFDHDKILLTLEKNF